MNRMQFMRFLSRTGGIEMTDYLLVIAIIRMRMIMHPAHPEIEKVSRNNAYYCR